MKGGGLITRAQYSLTGLGDAWRRERSFRTHVILSISFVGLLVFVHPPPVWWAIVVLALAVGLAFEVVNGALEALADLVKPRPDPRVRLIKDMASAAAFLVNCATIIIGTTVVFAHIHAV